MNFFSLMSWFYRKSKSPEKKTPQSTGSSPKSGNSSPLSRGSSVFQLSKGSPSSSPSSSGKNAKGKSTLSSSSSSSDEESENVTVSPSERSITTKKIKRLPSREEQEKMAPLLSLDYQKVFSPVFAEMSMINENLFLTGIGGMTRDNFAEFKITCVINATFEAPDLEIPGVDHIRVAVDDDVTDDMTQYFDSIADKIESVAKCGGRTVVHCVAGVSRSTTLVIAYLMKYKKMSLKEAFVFVQKKRKVAKPNSAFFHQLIRYEMKIHGKNSVRMVQEKCDGVTVTVPDFLEKEFPKLFMLEVNGEKNRIAIENELKESGVKREKSIIPPAYMSLDSETKSADLKNQKSKGQEPNSLDDATERSAMDTKTINQAKAVQSKKKKKQKGKSKK